MQISYKLVRWYRQISQVDSGTLNARHQNSQYADNRVRDTDKLVMLSPERMHITPPTHWKHKTLMLYP